jgi:C4-dicarboxylate transporter DctM subunit
MAGFLPGALVGFGLMITVYILAKKRGYKPSGKPFSPRDVVVSFKNAVWALATPVLILGGIYSGVFTPTEAATVSVLYSLVVGLFVHRELNVAQLPGIFVNAAVTTGAVLIILGFATAFARFITIQQVPQLIGQAVLSLSSDPTVILCIFVALILVTGMFIETGAQILIYTPLFLPILTQLGVDPIHFGIILIIGTEIGLITPPVGVNLFVAQGISGSSIGNLTRCIIPFLCSMLIAQLVLVFFPKLVLILPELFYRS